MEKNHIEAPTPAGRKPPPRVLRQLRRVDRSLDAHYLGRGRWAVGSHRPNRLRRQSAENKLEALAKNPEAEKVDKATMAVLALHGFSPIAVYEVPGVMWGEVVTDVRYRDWLFRHRAEQEFKKKMEGSTRAGRPTREERITALEDRIHQEYPFIFRGRTHPYVGV